MKGHGTAWLLFTWLLIHPYFSDSSAGPWLRLWHTVWYRNTWVAAAGFDTKAVCEAEMRRAMEFAVGELKKTPPDPQRREENLAWAWVRCVPADALGALPFSVRTGDSFGMF